MTVVAPDYLWSYRCNLKGCCCNAGWRIGLLEDDLERLRRAATGTDLAARVAALVPPLVESRFKGLIKAPASLASVRQRPEIGELPKGDDGACAFLEPAGRCEIHGRLGEQALPRVCQSFPVLAGVEGPVVRTTWELLCPEVARALAAAPGPATIVPAPHETTRAFIADSWHDSDATLPILGGSSHLGTSKPHEIAHATAAEAARFREVLAVALRDCADVPIATMAAALCELDRWARAGVAPSPEALLSSLTSPHRDVAFRASMLAVTEAARRRFMIIANDKAQVQRTLRLCRSFFAHHPWGTERTLYAVEDAFANPAGPLAAISADLDPATLFGPAERLVFANAAIAHQNLASAAGDSLLSGLARSLMILVDALFFRFIFAPPEEGQGPSPAECAATALALADTLHRGKDAGAGFFSDLLRHLVRSPAVLALARNSALTDDPGPARPISIGAILMAELRHERAATRAAAGWYGRLVIDWRARVEHKTAASISALTTPGLPLTNDAPAVIQALGTRAEIALLALGVAVATDATLPQRREMSASVAALLPEFTAPEVHEALRALTHRGYLTANTSVDPVETPTALAIAARVNPAVVAAALRS